MALGRLTCGLVLLGAITAAACGARPDLSLEGYVDSAGLGGGGTGGSGGGVGGKGFAGQPQRPGKGGATGFSCRECEQMMLPQCVQALCDEVLETCVVTNVDGVLCDTGDPCQVNGICSGGLCLGTPVQCPNPICGEGSVCQGGICSPSLPKNCSALDGACSVGVCDVFDGQCKQELLPDGSFCDDGDPCTILDECASGSCSGEATQACAGGDACCPDGCTTATDGDCEPVQITIDASERGWWSDIYEHSSDNDNTFTGWSDGVHNSYFTFDLDPVQGAVVSARLVLEFEATFGPIQTETVSIWDVSTVAATLEANGLDLAVFNDLQSGNSYGSFVVSPAQLGTLLTIELNAQAVNDLNLAAGGLFSVGLHLDTAAMGDEEGVRFSESTEPRTHQLVLDMVQ